MSIKGDRGVPYKVTATNATSSVATKSGVASTTIYITDIAGSSDKAGAKVLVKDGTTVIWQQVIGATSFAELFATPLAITAGADASVTVDSTSVGTANIGGFVINNS